MRPFPRLAACVLLVALSWPAAASEKHVVMLAESFWPFSYTDAGSQEAPRGVSVELAAEILEDAGLTFEAHMLPWPRVMKRAREAPNQLILTLIRTAEREPVFGWVGSVGRIRHGLYGLKANRDWLPSTLADARHLSVVSVPEDVTYDYLMQQRFSNIIRANSYLKGLEMLLRGRTDLYPGNAALLSYQCAQLGGGCDEIYRAIPLDELEQELYIAFSPKTDPALVQRVRSSYEKLAAAGRLEALLQLHKQYPGSQ